MSFMIFKKPTKFVVTLHHSNPIETGYTAPHYVTILSHLGTWWRNVTCLDRVPEAQTVLQSVTNSPYIILQDLESKFKLHADISCISLYSMSRTDNFHIDQDLKGCFIDNLFE